MTTSSSKLPAPPVPSEAGAVSAGLDIPTLAAHLDGRLPGFDASRPVKVGLLAGGRSNLTFRLRQDGGDWALRRPPLGHVMESAHDMRREHTVQSGLNRVGYPVPMMRLLGTDRSVLGADFYIMDFVAGTTYATAAQTAALPPEVADRLSREQVGVLAQLHSVDVAAAGLSDLGRPAGYLPRQVRRWGKQWESTKTRDLPGVAVLADWLAERAADVPDARPTLVHGDFRLDNLVVGPPAVPATNDSSSVLAVLDWEMSTLGDPVTDLAVALVYWSQVGDELRRALPVGADVTSAPGFWTRDEVAHEYSRLTGDPLAHLDIALALACLKLAVIMESIRYRTLAGHQRGVSTGEADAMGAGTEVLVEIGLRVTRGGGLEALGS